MDTAVGARASRRRCRTAWRGGERRLRAEARRGVEEASARRAEIEAHARARRSTRSRRRRAGARLARVGGVGGGERCFPSAGFGRTDRQFAAVNARVRESSEVARAVAIGAHLVGGARRYRLVSREERVEEDDADEESEESEESDPRRRLRAPHLVRRDCAGERRRGEAHGCARGGFRNLAGVRTSRGFRTRKGRAERRRARKPKAGFRQRRTSSARARACSSACAARLRRARCFPETSTFPARRTGWAWARAAARGASRVVWRSGARARDPHAPPLEPPDSREAAAALEAKAFAKRGSLKAFTRRSADDAFGSDGDERVHKSARAARANERVSISARTPRRAVHVRAAAIPVYSSSRAGGGEETPPGETPGQRESDRAARAMLAESSAQTDFEDVVAAVRPTSPDASFPRAHSSAGRKKRREKKSSRDARSRRSSENESVVGERFTADGLSTKRATRDDVDAFADDGTSDDDLELRDSKKPLDKRAAFLAAALRGGGGCAERRTDKARTRSSPASSPNSRSSRRWATSPPSWTPCGSRAMPSTPSRRRRGSRRWRRAGAWSCSARGETLKQRATPRGSTRP